MIRFNRFISCAVAGACLATFAPLANASMLGDVDTFAINLDEIIDVDVPGPGAGHIENPGSEDHYTFTIGSPQFVYFETLDWSSTGLRWTLVDPNDDVLFNRSIFNDAGRIELAEVGTYTLVVFGNNDATGTYSLTTWTIEDDGPFPIALDQTVDIDDPGPGAGNIEEPGNEDYYTIEITSAQIVYFEALDWTTSSLRWVMYDPLDNVMFDRFINNDSGRIEMTELGTYTIAVYSNSSTTGTYSFRSWTVDDDGPFDIALDQTVDVDDPGVGAGNIEDPGNEDYYTIDIDTPQTVYFDALDWSTSSLRWVLYDPSDSVVFDRFINNDGGRFELTETGTYMIAVYSNGSATGTYSFRSWTVDDDGPFAIDLEELIDVDQPGAGAGNIEDPGNQDTYTLTITEPTTVYFDAVDWSTTSLRWNVVDPLDDQIFDRFINNDGGRFELTELGTYTILVYSNSSTTGTYSFTVWGVDDDGPYELALDEVVDLDTPGPGSGMIEDPGNYDEFELDIDAGTMLCFESLDWSTSSLRWQAFDPNGDELFDTWINNNTGNIEVPLDGIYFLRVYGSGSTTGTYRLVVIESSIADINGDCYVDVSDLLELLAAWGPCDDPEDCPADITGDDTVDVNDLLLLLSEWTSF